MNTLRQSKRSGISYTFWFFVVISIPLMILVVGYTAGYRFDAKTKSVFTTSALAIETLPKDVIVVLNGQEEEQRTPYIRTLMPGRYTITLKKEGYYAWEKYISFEEGLSTIFPNVLLFKTGEATERETEPTLRAVGAGASRSLSPHEQAYYEQRGWQFVNDLSVIDGPQDLLIDAHQGATYVIPSSEDFIDTERLPVAVTHAEWLNDSTLLFASEFEVWTRIDDALQLLNRQSKPIADILWHPDGDYVFYSDETGLFVLELDERDTRQFWQLSSVKNPERLTMNSRGTVIHFESEGAWYSRTL